MVLPREERPAKGVKFLQSLSREIPRLLGFGTYLGVVDPIFILLGLFPVKFCPRRVFLSLIEFIKPAGV